MANIIQSVEKERGCGYRKKGGMYLMGGSVGDPCCKLPFELHVCPTCSSGIKPTRGWTWINSNLFSPLRCTMQPENTACPMNEPNVRMGLLWVGGKFYKTPDEFVKESKQQGVSRRISQLPREFKLGETWVALAHRDCIAYPAFEEGDGLKQITEYKPGIFQMFKPSRMDYVVKGDESEEELTRMEKRGFTLVNVIPDKDAQLEIATEDTDD